MKSIDDMKNRILEASNKNDRIIKGLWSVDCLYNPSGNNGRIFDYKFLVTQTIGQGVSYSLNYEYDRNYLRDLVGKDFMELEINDTALTVALLDSLYGVYFPAVNKTREVMSGASSEKMKWRTELVYKEAERLLGGNKSKSIVNIGVVGDFIQKFHTNGYDISGTDFDAKIIGNNVFKGVEIHNGEKTLDIISKADLAIITGMAVSTETIDDIIRCCLKNNVKMLVFAETGANLAGYYIEKGVDVYLSEHFPFYIYNGHSEIDVCRA